MAVELTARAETWPLAGTFTISRGSRTETELVVVELRDGEAVGRGECMANPRYAESMERVVETLEGLAPRLKTGLGRAGLQRALPPGAARNALDCALWDLESKRSGVPAWRLAGLDPLQPVVTAYTLSVDTPEKMAAAARANAHRPLMKLKLTGAGDLDRVAAVRENAPDTRLIVDANEAWSPAMVEDFGARLKPLGVELIEQPLPAGKDAMLAEVAHPVPVCADESCHTAADLDLLAQRYDCVNIKLDKSGGLTEALALRQGALERGLMVMVGCMIATSLSMAPGVLVAQGAAFVDLDGPLLLARDRPHGLRYDGSTVHPPDPALWG